MELIIYNPKDDGFVKEISWNYDEIKKEGNNTSNNAKFCEELETIVDEMFK